MVLWYSYPAADTAKLGPLKDSQAVKPANFKFVWFFVVLKHVLERRFKRQLKVRPIDGPDPVRNDLSKRCGNDVDIAKMSISALLLRLYRLSCADIDVLATWT